MTRRLLWIVLIACCFFAMGVIVEQRLELAEPVELPAFVARPAAGGAPNGEPRQAISMVLEVDGQVDRRNLSGTWQPLTVGAAVDADDEVRTGPGAVARLQLGTPVTVELAENTSINIAQLSHTLSRIRLQDGRVLAEVRAHQGFRFRVQVQGNGGLAETAEGRFGVMRRGAGPAVFASTDGALEVSGAGERVTLQSGEQTQVVEGGAPSAPTKLPKSLLLKLGQPPPSRMRSRRFQVVGETSAGAAVAVNQRIVLPNAAGRFTDTVALVDGPNEIFVSVEDVIGRKQSQRLPPVTIDVKAPNIAGKVVW